MKINEITESKQRVDEFVFTGAAALAMGGLAIGGVAVTGYEIVQNWQAYNRGEISGKELTARVGADVALGLIGGGIGGAIKVIRGMIKGTRALKAANKLDLKDANTQVKTAAEELKTANQLKKGTSRGSPDREVADKLKKDAIDDIKSANRRVGDLKGERWDLNKGRLSYPATGVGVGLAVPNEVEDLLDISTYKAFGGKGSKQPAPGTGMPDVSSGVSSAKPKPKPKSEKKPGLTVGQRWQWGKGGRKFPGIDNGIDF